ncbi:MAG: VIT domain-containing protein, partial [Chloroflexota bacterium]
VMLLICSWPMPAQADGVIIPEPPPHVPPVRVPNLTIKYHRVTVTIDNQVAITKIDQVFVNESPYDVEGTYIFPLPEGASISDFAMYVDGKRLSAEVLDADESRTIYEDIVRQRRDPAILEYIGRNAFRARIYPIPAHSEKRVQLEYSQILAMDQGIVRYVYPLSTEKFSPRPLEEAVVTVRIRSEEPIKSIYCSSHDVAIDRRDDYSATISYEEYDVVPDKDFELYYTISPEDFGLNLLSYRREEEDGFFLLLISPKIEVTQQEIVAKDVVVVLDTSGSMRGEKINQAKEALEFILDSLNPEDRFNIISFSTGIHAYADQLVPASESKEARRFVRDLRAVGGTNINRALLDALDQAQGERPQAQGGRPQGQGGRPQIIIFLTDGLATEGVIETERIISNVREAASQSARIFTFGVGDDVHTILLDTVAQEHKGASAYVRPGQDIEAKVSSFYAKVSSPLLADLDLDFGGIRVEDVYPYPLPDLFAGTQLIVVGLYRHGGNTDIALRGTIDGYEREFLYRENHFRNEGGASFIPRLWATRKVGYLLSEIRLHGENRELIDEIVELSVRYGIVTPYTSFLIDEEEDALTDAGRERLAAQEMAPTANAARAPAFGAGAVDKSVAQESLRTAHSVPGSTHEQVKHMRDKSFILREEIWTDTTFDPSRMKTTRLVFGSDAYFSLLASHPEWGAYFSLGEEVIVLLDGEVYQVVRGDQGVEHNPSTTPTSPIYSDHLLQHIWQWIRGLID